MKRLLGALLAGTAMLSPALAADMAVKAPVVSPAYNWTGFYLGLSGGYAWQDLVIVIDPATGVDSTVRAASGGLIGGQIGYNWQIGSVVLGLEGDGHWASIKRNTANYNSMINAGVMPADSTINALATARLRLGTTMGPLFGYVTGGGALMHRKLSIPAGFAVGPAVGSEGKTQFGFAAGGGVEYAFGRNWTAKAEYMFYSFDGQRFFGSVNGDPINLHTVKGGFNFRL